MRPNFLIIGAQKCGTSSLYELLKSHPEIGMSSMKETHFFSRDENYARGWAWYESLFAGTEGKRAVGEASPTYSKIAVFPQALPRIVEHLPDARLIYIVRHPLTRMESAYVEIRHNPKIRIHEDFATALRTRPVLVEASLYWKQISAYRNHYPDDRILVLFLEDFRQDPHAQLRRCFEFLDVDPTFRAPDADRPRNSREGRQTVSDFALWLHRLPFYNTLRRYLPARFHGRLHYQIKNPQWDEETRRWAIEQVIEDSLQFLRFYGKPLDFWDLRPSPEGMRPMDNSLTRIDV